MARLLLAILAAQAVFSTRTEVVTVPVIVLDSAGRRVTGLTQNDFRVYEDGRPVSIVAFQQGDVPITLGLVVDYSLSMRSKLPAIVEAVKAFAESTRPGDEMFVVRFNDQIVFDASPEQPFSSDAGRLAAALEQGTPGGATALYDGLIEALQHLRQGTRDRKALIVVSDGGDTTSGRTLAEVVRTAQQSDAVIYVIGLRDATDSKRDLNALKGLASRSGGEAVFPAAEADVARALRRIAQDLREQYTIGFTPGSPTAGERVRKIEVKVSANGAGRLRVRARSSYTPGASEPELRPAARRSPATLLP